MKKGIKRISIIIMLIGLFLILTNAKIYAADKSIKSIANVLPSVEYKTHVQKEGWQNYVSNGATSGTNGKSLRLEGIKIKLNSPNLDGGIRYCTQIQGIGWQGWKTNDAMSGTEGQSKRLEAIKIELTGEIANQYDIYYRVHCQQIGWMGWAKNGAPAGTAGYSYRLEGIQIVLTKKYESAPGLTTDCFRQKDPSISYRTHVQKEGWQKYVSNGATSGTSGKSLRLEGINIKVSNLGITGNIEYRTHVQNIGWQNWVKNGAMAGTSGQSLRLEAIQIKLTGDLAEKYDVYYRVHSQEFGWLGWAKNGESAGTEGLSFRLEAIQIKLVKKGASAPGETICPYVRRVVVPESYYKTFPVDNDSVEIASLTNIDKIEGFYVIDIPKTINGKNVVQINHSAFSYKYYLVGAIIPNTVTMIDNYAFCGNGYFKYLKLPDSVNFIKDKAFYQTKIEAIEIPKNVVYVGINAFPETTKLYFARDILTKLPSGAYEYCYAILEGDVYCNYDKAYEVLRLTNEERKAQGLQELKMDKDLLEAAMQRAAEINVHFSHTRPDATSCFTACDKMSGENIECGYGTLSTAKEAVDGWMNSSGHKANILNKNFNSIGIGVAEIEGAYYWVQCFGWEEADVPASKKANGKEHKYIYVAYYQIPE